MTFCGGAYGGPPVGVTTALRGSLLDSRYNKAQRVEVDDTPRSVEVSGGWCWQEEKA